MAKQLVNPPSNGASQEQKISDKRLYEIGDKSRSGIEIAGIHHSSVHYIIFKNETDSLCWEIDNAPRWANEAVSECKRLLGLTDSYLSRKHKLKMYSFLAGALSNALSSAEESDVKKLFSDAESYIEKYKNEMQSIIAHGHDFEICKTKNGGIQWFHKKLPPHLNTAVEEFESLHSLSQSILSIAHRKTASRMLGSALSVSFRKGENENALEPFVGTRQFIFSQVEAHWRIRLFLISLLSTILCITTLSLIGYFSSINIIYILGSGAGIVGAMVSALQRNNKIIIEPYSSGLSFYCESFSRLVVGIVFGLFVVLCAKSELALATFKDNLYAISCFSFIAGFSERFVPDLMSSVTKNKP